MTAARTTEPGKARTPEEPVRSAPPARIGLDTPAGVLELQRAAGNRTVTRTLARREARADWSSQARAEATAAATRARLRTALIPYMTRHSRRIVRNTAELFTGTAPLLTVDAITKRSDSAALVGNPAARPGWVTPGRDDAFFTGVTMSNVDYHDKDMIGTLEGTVMYVRGHDSTGRLQTLEEMANTVVHEVSHFFVTQYGELPETRRAGSFHRYADEFRAYWVEGRWGDLPAARRAERIREHLVGRADDPGSGYGALRAAYFARGRPNRFREQVDALTGPLGYNLVNSIRLHRLWQLFREQAAGRATIDDLVFAIARLPASERAEAARSTLIRGLERSIGGDGARRVRAALSAPTSAEYVGGLNPSGSAGVNRFLGAVIHGRPELLKSTYTSLSREDRRALMRNPAFMAFVDHHLLDSAMRAAVWAMTETWSTRQFDAMLDFIEALRRAKAEADAGTLTAVPEYVTEALARLHRYSRWTLFSWSREGAMREYVDVLPRRVAWEIRERLRD